MRPKSLLLAGRLDNEDFQKNFECFEFLKTDRPNEFTFVVLEMMPIEWEAHLVKLQERIDKDKVASTTQSIVYSEDMSEFWCGSSFAMQMCLDTNFKLFPFPEDSTDPESYKNQALRRYKQFLARTGHKFCWFQIGIGNELVDQKVVFELFTDLCPLTCENFRHLCIGDCAEPDQGVQLTYRGSDFFRIVKEGWIQGGDIINNKGNGGHSIYGPEFPDECFSLRHTTEGVLGMANNGKNTNASQFYITAARNSWMDGKYVAFGRVIEGISVVHQIHNSDTKPNQMPIIPIVVADCGEFDLNC